MPRQESKTSARAIGPVAAKILQQRLKLVVRSLRKAIAAGPKGGEEIHQLRVAARRANAAIDLFAPLLSKKQANWFRRQLRKLRKQADAARNIDVLRARLKEIPPAIDKQLRRQRRAAIVPLAKKGKELREDKRWTRHARKFVADLKGKKAKLPAAKQLASDYAAQSLAPIVASFTASLAMRKPSPLQLHKLRIAGKQLRYALELLAPVLAASASREVLQALTRLQDELGAINDRVTSLKMLPELRRTVTKTAEKQWLRQQASLEAKALTDLQRQLLRDWPPIKRRHLSQRCRQLTSSQPTKSKVPTRRKKPAKRRRRSKTAAG